MMKNEQEKIDAALDAALDGLEEDDDDDDNDQNVTTCNDDKYKGGNGHAKEAEIDSSIPCASIPIQDHLIPPSPMNPADMNMTIDEMMKQLDFGADGENIGQADEFLGRLLQEMQTQLGAEPGKNSPSVGNTNSSRSSPAKGKSNAKKPPPGKKKHSSPSTEASSRNDGTPVRESGSDVDEAIASLIDGVTNQAKLDEPKHGPSPGDGAEDEMLKNMMNQLGEGFGEDGVNAEALIDGMMEQLLSKDLMYEPIKKVSEKFPDWLKQNKEKLPETEYEQRCKQCKCFQKLVDMYDKEPENVQSLMLLMQEVQEFGQPPQEIIQDIAPGLELDADGLPKMDGDAGFSFPPGGDEECRIM